MGSSPHSLYARLGLTPREGALARALDDVAILWAFGEVPIDRAFLMVRAALGVPVKELKREWNRLDLFACPSDHRNNRRKLRALYRACGAGAA